MFYLFKNDGFKQGLTFGVISSIISVLGLIISFWIIGEKIEVLIVTLIAVSISNVFSDAFSIYISNKTIQKNDIAIISASLIIFVKIFLPFIFVLSLYFLNIKKALAVNIILGFVLIILIAIYISKINNDTSIVAFKRILSYFLIIYIILFFITICNLILYNFKSNFKLLNY